MGFFWLIVPLSVVAAAVIVRRRSPLWATLAGTLLTFGIVVGIVFPLIAYSALRGNFDNTAYCDGFCFNNGEGFLFATFIMLYVAIPTSLVGGAVSFVASLFTPRSARSA